MILTGGHVFQYRCGMNFTLTRPTGKWGSGGVPWGIVAKQSLVAFAFLAFSSGVSGQRLQPPGVPPSSSTPVANVPPAETLPPLKRGVLLLRNGQTFTGAYRHTNDHYTIVDPNGSSIRFTSGQVEFISDSLLEVYAYQRAKRIRNNVPACLELAQWCMHHGLYIKAREQLKEAVSLEPSNPTIQQFTVRLDLLMSPPRLPIQPGLPHPTPSSASPVNMELIQQRVDRLNPAVVQHFVIKIQPLLFNRCALAGCHGPNPQSDYILFRTSVRKAVPQRVTLRNLYNTLQQIELNQPVHSQLLLAATSAHGGQREPSLKLGQTDQISRLVNWVRAVSTSPEYSPDNPDVKASKTPIQPQTNRFFAQQMQVPASLNLHKMATPDNQPSRTQLNPPITTPSRPDDAGQAHSAPFQQWLNRGEELKKKDALQHGITLPVEMQDPRLGTLKIEPAQKVNLTPGMESQFSLPSDRILRSVKPGVRTRP